MTGGGVTTGGMKGGGGSVTVGMGGVDGVDGTRQHGGVNGLPVTGAMTVTGVTVVPGPAGVVAQQGGVNGLPSVGAVTVTPVTVVPEGVFVDGVGGVPV